VVAARYINNTCGNKAASSTEQSSNLYHHHHQQYHHHNSINGNNQQSPSLWQQVSLPGSWHTGIKVSARLLSNVTARRGGLTRRGNA